MEREIILNSVECLNCGEVLISHHRHDFKECGCENGTCVDGGDAYLRYGGKDMSLVKSVAVFSDEPFTTIRENLYRGTYGKNGDEPLRYVKLSEINDEWLDNLIEYEETHRPDNKYLKYYKTEKTFRNV